MIKFEEGKAVVVKFKVVTGHISKDIKSIWHLWEYYDLDAFFNHIMILSFTNCFELFLFILWVCVFLCILGVVHLKYSDIDYKIFPIYEYEWSRKRLNFTIETWLKYFGIIKEEPRTYWEKKIHILNKNFIIMLFISCIVYCIKTFLSILVILPLLCGRIANCFLWREKTKAWIQTRATCNKIVEFEKAYSKDYTVFINCSPEDREIIAYFRLASCKETWLERFYIKYIDYIHDMFHNVVSQLRELFSLRLYEFPFPDLIFYFQYWNDTDILFMSITQITYDLFVLFNIFWVFGAWVVVRECFLFYRVPAELQADNLIHGELVQREQKEGLSSNKEFNPQNSFGKEVSFKWQNIKKALMDSYYSDTNKLIRKFCIVLGILSLLILGLLHFDTYIFIKKTTRIVLLIESMSNASTVAEGMKIIFDIIKRILW